MVQLRRLLRQVAGVFVLFAADALAKARKRRALRLHLLLNILAELRTLLWRHPVEGLFGRRSVVLSRQLRSNLLIALQHFLVGVALVRRPLLITRDLVLQLLLLLGIAQQIIQ